MDLLKRENVQILQTASDWKDAIYQAVRPLEQHGYVEARYKDEIISNVNRLGPYFIVAEHIAMPHARPEQGAIETQIGVTLFREDICFGDADATARLFVTLCAKDADSHLNALMEISALLSDDDTVANILASKDADTLFQYFQ